MAKKDAWISAQDRLPEEGYVVLAIASGRPRANITLKEAYQIAEWCQEDGWILQEFPEWEDAEVTHWMPLPEPPKKECRRSAMALRCGKCQYRAKRTDGYRCNYCLITGRTRRAVPPERCRNFQAEDRIEPKSAEAEALRETARKKEKKPRAPGAGAKPRFDWEEARRLYDQGANDGQIGRALGCRPQAVRSWRKRRGLPANTLPGGNRTAPQTTFEEIEDHGDIPF